MLRPARLALLRFGRAAGLFLLGGALARGVGFGRLAARRLGLPRPGLLVEFALEGGELRGPLALRPLVGGGRRVVVDPSDGSSTVSPAG